ncbi:MAG TPA: Na-translocating system protein MpsC family protein [Solirubrobacterales bacterium]|nr:Na-translocating system protein MpsC family protein [Solirubrobacterales bacterium]HNG57832.1 Na-translocating system protein MpsC family protein [Solirubrobacterales bacterium]
MPSQSFGAARMTGADPGQATGHRKIAAEISDGMIELIREFYGTEPSRTSTIYQDDLVLVVIVGGFTTIEKTLSEAGRTEEVSRLRHAFQDVMESRFKALVENATGRKVTALLSGDDENPDMLGEMFLLESREGPEDEPAG